MRRLLALGVMAAMLSFPAASIAAKKERDEPKEPEGSRIYGKVRTGTGETVPGAVVRLFHLASSRAFAAEPTSADGEYEIKGLPFGYFEIVVEVDDGVFVGGEVVSVPPSGKTLVLLTLEPYDRQTEAWWSTHERRPLPPGMEGEPAGLAGVIRKGRGAEFWKTPKGVAIIAGSGAALLLWIAVDNDENQELLASPSAP